MRTLRKITTVVALILTLLTTTTAIASENENLTEEELFYVAALTLVTDNFNPRGATLEIEHVTCYLPIDALYYCGILPYSEPFSHRLIQRNIEANSHMFKFKHWAITNMEFEVEFPTLDLTFDEQPFPIITTAVESPATGMIFNTFTVPLHLETELTLYNRTLFVAYKGPVQEGKFHR